MEFRVTTPFGATRIYAVEGTGRRGHAVVVPGYSETIAHSGSLVDALAREGFDAFTFSQPRRLGQPWPQDPIERQADVLLAVMEARAPEGTALHAVGHSLGAAAALRAAPRAPERFASLILMQPLGLSGPQRLREQATRVGRKTMRNQLAATRRQDDGPPPRRGYAAAADRESALRYSRRVARAQFAGCGVLARHVRLALGEANAAGTYDMADDAAKAHELGIPIHLVTAHADELFDAAKVDAGTRRIVDSLRSASTVADAAARHDTSWLQPARSAQIVSQLLRAGPDR